MHVSNLQFIILCLAIWTMTSFMLLILSTLDSLCCIRICLDPGRQDTFPNAVNAVKSHSQDDQKIKTEQSYESPCSDMPNKPKIKMNNIYWQHVQLNSNKSNVYLYAAYYDSRNGTSIRVLAMADFTARTRPKTFCQFWFETEQHPRISVKASYDFIWNEDWGYNTDSLMTALISCPISVESEVPFAVSLAESKCGSSTSALPVYHPIPNDRKRIPADPGSMAVCVKGLAFPDEDLSARFVEWLELLKLLGVRQVFLYELALTAKTRRTLLHYQESGFVELTPLTIPGKWEIEPERIIPHFRKSPLQRRMHEVMAYNDCLYRNLYRYEYLAVFDIDEVILPKNANIFTWKELLEEFGDSVLSPESTISSVCARNAYFFNDFESQNLPDLITIPPYMHMLRHVTRADRHSKPGLFLKCFHLVSQVLSLHNHLPLKCFSRCKYEILDTSLGQLHHYREGCGPHFNPKCQIEYANRTIIDTTMWKYKDWLVENSNQVLKKLGYLD